LNCSKLYLGQEVKNYKEMCKLLRENEYEGNSKKSQLKEWCRYFGYEKAGQKFLIKDIYNEPLPKTDRRINGNNSVYIAYIELLLMKYLAAKPGNNCELVKKDLYLNLFMVNQNYILYADEKNRGALIKNIDGMTQFDVRDFYRRVPTRLDKILVSALNNLRNRFLIEYCEEYVVVEKDGDTELHRTAADNEVSYIIKTKNKVLENLELQSMVQIYYRFSRKKFFNLTNKVFLRERNWLYVYKQYKIIFIGDEIKNNIPVAEFEYAKNELNKKIVEVLCKQAVSQFCRNIDIYSDRQEQIVDEHKADEMFWGTLPDYALEQKNEKYKLHPKYVQNQNKLVDYLIKLNAIPL